MLKGTAFAALGSLSPFSLPSLARAIQTSSTPYQRPKLKITDVRTAQVLVHGPQTHVRIYTDQGIYGQGEATDAAVGASSLIRAGGGCSSDSIRSMLKRFGKGFVP